MLQRERRHCAALNNQGSPCGQAPLIDREHCFWHDPEHADEAREARRLGGMRRRRENIIIGTFELDGLADVAAIRRLLEVAMTDALGLDNSNTRSRTLVLIARAGADLLKVAELDQRIIALENVTMTYRRKR